ncbi:MAG: family 20 glycosylhydrolase [Lentisphaeria bacterium]|nr:family 20 glycosylhydrolase [Lentisphaeria bacterium]
MNDAEVKILTDRLIPVPKKIKFEDGAVYPICNRSHVTLTVPPSGDIDYLETAKSLFLAYWQVYPSFAVETVAGTDLPDEGYRIEVSETELAITAGDYAGLLNAMKTLRQLAEVERGTEKLAGYFLVRCEIEDAPAMPFRGIHLCIFPETPLWDIEKQIRLAAYHKFNYAVIETWGVFPFESHPEFCWADRKIDKKELKRLIRLGWELGITLIPQFNLLGHAAASRSITGKHAVLDFNPALQPLFEPEGWTWCISNPETRRILTDLVLELYEFYCRPPFFHIGCDEADNIGTCRECRKQVLKDLVRDHILYFHELFRKHGTRIIMWHDMLLQKGDPRWKGYTVCGLPEHKLDQLYRELPRDIIIADWQYRADKVNPDDPEPEWPTVQFFKKEKFPVVVCPWINDGGTASLGRLAAKEKLFGMLETTWHISHDAKYRSIYWTAAASAWNPNTVSRPGLSHRLSVAFHLRQIGWDMGVSEYEKTGFSQNQVDPGHHPHQLI